jgi:CRP-like cAMP-binding protein
MTNGLDHKLEGGPFARVEPVQGRTNGLLERLAPADMALLQPHLKLIELRRGDILYEARSAIDRVYFPLSGMISLLAVTREGDMIETGVIGHEGVAGSSVAADNSQSFCQTMVQIPGMGLQISSANFIKACQGSLRLQAVVNRHQAVILLQAQQNGACHALHSVEARLARWLLQSQDMVASSTIDLTQEFLSYMLGVQRTSVSLVAHKLQEAGLIHYSRGRILVADRAGLKECACECYAVVRGEIDKALPPNTAAAGLR